jgi:hypothetical protein
MKYQKAFLDWWKLRKNEMPFAPEYVVYELKKQCYRAWLNGRKYEKESLYGSLSAMIKERLENDKR